MAQDTSGNFVTTLPVVIDHPNLFEPRRFGKAGSGTGEPKYDARFVMGPDNPDLAQFKRIVLQVAASRWPNRSFINQWRERPSKFSMPFEMGDSINQKRLEKDSKAELLSHLAGMVVLTARSKFAPRLAVVKDGSLIDLTAENRAIFKDAFYPGALCLAEMTLKAYQGVGQNPDGVTAYLNFVVATGKGTRLAGGGRTAAEVFSGYAGTVTADNPLDDEIPF